MSAWITITAEDLNDYQVGAQVEALRTAALADNQADPFDNIAADVITRMRAEIQGHPSNRVSATAGTIPPDLKWVGCWLILEAMQTRLPGLELTEEQKRMIDDAHDYLKRVAKGEVPIETPNDPIAATVQTSSGIYVANSSTKAAGRNNLSGL